MKYVVYIVHEITEIVICKERDYLKLDEQIGELSEIIYYGNDKIDAERAYRRQIIEHPSYTRKELIA